MTSPADTQTMKRKMDNKVNALWFRIAIVVAPLTILGAVAWGALRQEVTQVRVDNNMIHPDVFNNTRDIAVLETRYNEIAKKLDRILDKLDK